MKYIVILGDGMADEALEMLDGKTPLEYADTPTMDQLAGAGQIGLCQNVPQGMAPGSDVANLSVLGYDPRVGFTGRSPLEALSVGVDMEPGDVIFRANLVTLTPEEPYLEKRILDHSAGEISTQEADELMQAIRENLNTSQIQFFTGTSYRQICRWRGGRMAALEPPHDHLGSSIGPFLPREPVLRELMERSYEILHDHPVNRQREARGQHQANSLWFWGPGTKPALPAFREKTGMKGAMISGVDLLKGIGLATGMKVLSVTGATGGPNTYYEGKAQAATQALLEEGADFVYVHVEAPDEMGHLGQVWGKVQTIEALDHRLIAPLKQKMDASGEAYRMLVLPDHPTPVSRRCHTAQPVPYLLYDSTRQMRKIGRYSEKEAALVSDTVVEGWHLLDQLLER